MQIEDNVQYTLGWVLKLQCVQMGKNSYWLAWLLQYLLGYVQNKPIRIPRFFFWTKTSGSTSFTNYHVYHHLSYMAWHTTYHIESVFRIDNLICVKYWYICCTRFHTYSVCSNSNLALKSDTSFDLTFILAKQNAEKNIPGKPNTTPMKENVSYYHRTKDFKIFWNMWEETGYCWSHDSDN